MSHRHSDSGIPWLYNRIQELEQANIALQQEVVNQAEAVNILRLQLLERRGMEKENARFRKALETIRELDISVGAWPIAYDALEGNVDDNPAQEDSL